MEIFSGKNVIQKS